MTTSITFDRTQYGPNDPISFQVAVDGDPGTRQVTFTGSVTLTDRTVVPVTGDTTVGVEYGAFTAAGYDVVQDPVDPSRYTATPQPVS